MVKNDSCPPCLQSGTLNVLQVTDDERVVLDTLLILLESWNWAHSSGIKCQEQLWGQWWPKSSLSPVRNPQCPPSHLWLFGGSWHFSNHARKLKFGPQIENHIWRTFTMLRMTHILHVSSQEPSMSSKSLKMTGVSWNIYNHYTDLKLSTHVYNSAKTN